MKLVTAKMWATHSSRFDETPAGRGRGYWRITITARPLGPLPELTGTEFVEAGDFENAWAAMERELEKAGADIIRSSISGPITRS